MMHGQKNIKLRMCT